MEIIQDERPENPDEATVRVLDFTDSESLSLSVGAGSESKSIWDSLSDSSELLAGLPDSSTSFIQLRELIDGKQLDLALFQLDKQRGSAHSLVIFNDRYGRPTMLATEDARSR